MVRTADWGTWHLHSFARFNRLNRRERDFDSPYYGSMGKKL